MKADPAWRRFLPALLAALVFVTSLALLAPRVARSIGTGDRAEFVIVSVTLGIPHPTGYPVYSWLGNLFTLWPAGPVPARVGFLSAFCAAAALAASAFLVARTLRAWRVPDAAGLGAALLAVVLLGGTPVFQHNALVPEVYTMKALFGFGVLLLLLRHATGASVRWLYGAALLLGLGLGVHLSLVFLGATVLLALWVRRTPVPQIVRALAVGALGASCLFYLYLRAAMEPAYLHPQAHFFDTLRWTGSENGLYNWAWFVTGGRWHGSGVEGPAAVVAKLGELAGALVEGLGPVALLLAALAIAATWREGIAERRLPVALLALFGAGEIFYFASYAPSQLDMVVPLFAVLATLAGIGLGLLHAMLCAARERLPLARQTRAALLLGVATMAALPALSRPLADRSGEDEALRLVEAVAAAVPAGSVVDGHYWSYSRTALYLELVEGRALPFRFAALDPPDIEAARGFALGREAADDYRARGYRVEPRGELPGGLLLYEVGAGS